MNESKFTSGPWSVGNSGEGLWWVAGPNHNENVICDIVPRGNLNDPNGEDLANARLIAAAPALYDTLSKVRDTFADLEKFLRMVGRVPSADACQIAKDAANDVLALADGIKAEEEGDDNDHA